MVEQLPLNSLVSFSMTMSDDAQHRITELNLPFFECNIHVYTNAAKYGAMGVCEAVVNAGDVVYFTKGNLKDFLFQNNVAGNNTTIVAVATVPTYYLKEVLG